MKTKILSVTELKNIATEILLSKTNKISKISVGSIFNAVAYGIAKIAQKCLMEIALIESQLFPEAAVGEILDDIAKRYGIFNRLGATKSSCYIYLFAEPGTIYNKDKVKFVSNDGITFKLNSNITIDENKYTYALATSNEVGTKANVSPLSIYNCVNAPVGHLYCTNTFAASGGRNIESDDEFRNRIININNSVSTKTLEYLTQIALRFNNNILKFVHLGTYQGKTKLGIYTQSGAALTSGELNNLSHQMREYLALSDISDELNNRVYFCNVDYVPIDLSIKLSYMKDKYSINEIYSSIQKKLLSFIDYRYLNTSKNISWIDLYDIVKNTEGVINVNYGEFLVNQSKQDIVINKAKLPKFREMIIYDLEGGCLLDNSSKYMPFIYPVYKDLSYDILIKE